jgi:hypothetical protein
MGDNMEQDEAVRTVAYDLIQKIKQDDYSGFIVDEVNEQFIDNLEDNVH